MIYLNFAGESVMYGLKPGQVKYYDATGNMRNEKEFPLIQAPHWKQNPFTKRLQGITAPHLGSNMYAADRTKPPVPLKLSAFDDTVAKPKTIEESPKVQQEEISVAGASMEFNQLANLIGIAAGEKDSQVDDYKFNLFPEAVFDTEGGRLGAGDAGQIINIDLGKKKSEQVSQMMKDFEGLGVASKVEDTGDDLLDLMDSL